MKKLEANINGIKAVVHYVSNKFIVCCHGLYSNKDSKKYVELAELASKEGLSCVRFDFRGCGESEGSFEKSTLTKRLKDLEEVINFIKSKYDAKIALFGSSFGGMVSILYASKKGNCLVAMATPYKIEGKESRFVDADVIDAIKNCSKILIMHGLKDELVSKEQAKILYSCAKEPKEILLFNADHSFSDEKIRREALLKAISWIKKFIDI